MRRHIFPAVPAVSIVLGAFVSLVAVAAGPPSDACRLLTPAAVTAVLGVRVGAGAHKQPSYPGICTWEEAAAAPLGGRSVVISFKSSEAFEVGKGLAEMHRRMLGGVGDEAYFGGMGRARRQPVLNVKKGAVAFNVVIYGDVPAERAKSMEKRLARRVLARL